MPRSIFVSYKYADSDVRPLPPKPPISGTFLGGGRPLQPQFGPLQPLYGGLIPVTPTTARNYVDLLESHLDFHDHVYKGENDGESLAGFKDETIESKLRAKIFGTSITIVLISKNMKDPALKEEDQWIPWEISYSLKEMTKAGRTSKTNGMLAVVLPDRNGSYEHFISDLCTGGCKSWHIWSTFSIIGKNMFNRKLPNTYYCQNHPGGGVVHSGNDHSYIYPVKWDEFIAHVNGYINLASQISQNTDHYEIVKAN